LRRLLKIRIKEKSRDATQELSQFLKEILIHSTYYCIKEKTPIYSVYGRPNDQKFNKRLTKLTKFKCN